MDTVLINNLFLVFAYALHMWPTVTFLMFVSSSTLFFFGVRFWWSKGLRAKHYFYAVFLLFLASVVFLLAIEKM
jgi:hypothetical protein